MEKRIIQVEEKSSCKIADTLKYPAHVCHVRCNHSGADSGKQLLCRRMRRGAVPRSPYPSHCSAPALERCCSICARKFKVPAFLGSSFAFLSGFAAVANLNTGKYASMSVNDKAAYACGGIVVAGLLYLIFALIIRMVASNA